MHVHIKQEGMQSHYRSKHGVNTKVRMLRKYRVWIVIGIVLLALLSFYKAHRKSYTSPPFSESDVNHAKGQDGANKLLLASHGRLFWYDHHTEDLFVLHEGEVSCNL